MVLYLSKMENMMCFRDEPREVAELLRETADLIERIDFHDIDDSRACKEDFVNLGRNIIKIYVNIHGVVLPMIDRDALVHSFL